MRGWARRMQWRVIDDKESWDVIAIFDRALEMRDGQSLVASSLPFAAAEGYTIKVSVVAADGSVVDETSATITRRRLE